MDGEFSDTIQHQAHSIDPSYCQAWETCAEQYYHYSTTADNGNAHHHGNRHLYDNYEGESRGYADDATWILTSSFVIFTMQSGFGMLEAGSCSPGFEVNIMMKNIVDVVFTALTYYLVGYGISFGQPCTPFMGKGNMPADGGYEGVESGLVYSKYIFQLSFAATSTTIVSGCVAMRLKFFVYILYSLIAVIFYSFIAHWLFDESGWLNQMGAHDFAGGASVHLFGGTNGLIATAFLGPRTGRFDGSRPISDFFPSSPASQCLGLLALWWGWIGFNCGSSFGITDDRWVVAIRCAVTTVNSTVGGGIAAIIYSLWRTQWRLVIPEHIINGILGALVAITPSCASTHTFDAFPIGAIGALVALAGNTLLCHCRIDDPVGAIGVHAGSSMWGLIAVGLFADSKLPGIDVMDGLIRGGGFKLLGLQGLTIVTTIGWSLMWSTTFFYSVGVLLSRDWKDPRKGLRVDLKEEEMGADLYLHGVRPATSDYSDDEDDLSFSPSEDGERQANLMNKSDMYVRSNIHGQNILANVDQILDNSHDEDGLSSLDIFLEHGSRMTPGSPPSSTSHNGVRSRSLLLGNIDDLMENKDQEDLDDSGAPSGGGAEDLEVLDNSINCASNIKSAAGSSTIGRVHRLNGDSAPSRRRLNHARSQQSILGMSLTSNNSQTRARMMHSSRKSSTAERNLKIYR